MGCVKFVSAIIIATAFTATAAWFFMGRNGESGPHVRETASSTTSPVASAPRTEEESKALARFRALRHSTEDDPPTFKEIQSLAASLPTALLIPLLDEFTGSMREGIDGWRRAALWAEIGKRAPARGKALLESRFPPKESPQDSGDPFPENADSPEDSAAFHARMKPFQQRPEEEANLAAFAYLRGRIEACNLSPQALEPLIADFHSLAEGISNEGWSSRVDEMLFRSLARRDPELAWQILPGAKKDSPLTQYRGFFTYPSFQGFFDGLDSRKEVTDYAYRWLDYWKSPAVKSAYTQDGHEDEQWYYRGCGTSCIIVDALDRLHPDAVDAWVGSAYPFYSKDDLKHQREMEDPPPDESLLEFPEAHRVFIPKSWSKP